MILQGASAAPGTSVLVDANVLMDVLTEDPAWFEWSAGALAGAADQAVLVLNPIVYAEVSVGFSTIEELDVALSADRYRREPLPWDAGFLAGKAFREYRRRGGSRRSPLPDFYIGAHAAPCHPARRGEAASAGIYSPSVLGSRPITEGE